jgi:hypothetical protein
MDGRGERNPQIKELIRKCYWQGESVVQTMNKKTLLKVERKKERDV